MTTAKRMSPVDDMNYFFDKAAEHLKLEEGVRQMLKTPSRELKVAVPVRMDNGKIKVFTG